jgi:hypothetical protein
MLKKDRESLLAFYDFATVRHCTTRTRNCVSRLTFLDLALKLRSICYLRVSPSRTANRSKAINRSAEAPSLTSLDINRPYTRLDIVSCKRSPRPILMTSVSPL